VTRCGEGPGTRLSRPARSGADVAWTDGTLTHVGPGHAGPVDTEVDGRGLMVMPGLVDVHSHPSSEPMLKGLTDGVGTPGLCNSSLYEYLPIFRPPPDAVALCSKNPAGWPW